MKYMRSKIHDKTPFSQYLSKATFAMILNYSLKHSIQRFWTRQKFSICSRGQQKTFTCCYHNSLDSQFVGEFFTHKQRVLRRLLDRLVLLAKPVSQPNLQLAFPWFLKDGVITSKAARVTGTESV